MRCSSTRSAAISACSNWLLPQMCNAGPSDAFSRRTSSMPLMRCDGLVDDLAQGVVYESHCPAALGVHCDLGDRDDLSHGRTSALTRESRR